MNRTILKRSKGAAISIMALGLFLLILGAIMVPRSNICGMGFVFVASIAFIAIGLYAFFDRRPQASVSSNGLWVRSVGTQVIPWSMVTSAKLKWLPRSGDFITITLADGQTHTFFAEGLEVSSKDLLRIINEQIEQAD